MNETIMYTHSTYSYIFVCIIFRMRFRARALISLFAQIRVESCDFRKFRTLSLTPSTVHELQPCIHPTHPPITDQPHPHLHLQFRTLIEPSMCLKHK